VDINPFDILKNAQKIQEQMGVFQERLSGVAITGSSGGGMVEIEMNGRMEVNAVTIREEAMEDREMLQDLVASAFNNCVEKTREAVSREMGAIAGQTLQGMPGFQAS